MDDGYVDHPGLTVTLFSGPDLVPGEAAHELRQITLDLVVVEEGLAPDRDCSHGDYLKTSDVHGVPAAAL